MSYRSITDRRDLSTEELAKHLGCHGILKMLEQRETNAKLRQDQARQKDELFEQQVSERISYDERVVWLIQYCATKWGCTVEDLGNPNRRNPEVCMARHVTMYVLRDVEGESYPAIAERLTKQTRSFNHSSIIRGYRKIQTILGCESSSNAAAIYDVVNRYITLRGGSAQST